MRLHLALLVSVVATVAAFRPVVVSGPEGDASGTEWQRVGEGNLARRGVSPELCSIKLKRTSYPDDGTHPEIRNVRAANAATRRYRRRGIEGPELDTAAAVRQVEDSLRRRGLLGERQADNRVQTTATTSRPLSIVSSRSPATPTRSANTRAPPSSTRLPIPTPKTKDSLGVGQDGEDLAYFAEINFGSNNKTFVLVIDTGSSDTWIPSDSCKSRACRIHSTYGDNDSETFTSTNIVWDIRYGTGDVVGVVVSDIVNFAGFTMNMSFGLATKVSDDFVQFPIDGIMGLGFTNANQQGVPTIMDELVAQNQIARKLFGVALSRNADGLDDGVLNFGAVDPTLYDGEIKFAPSISQYGLWELDVDSATVDGQQIAVGPRTAIIDTGTSLLLLPVQDAMNLHSFITDSETDGEMFSIPCSTTANISFAFGGVTYTIPPADYVGRPIFAGSHQCISYIMARDISGRNTWLFGDVFLRNVYSVYDMDNNRVGFAPRKNGTSSETPTVSATSTSASRTGSRTAAASTGSSNSGGSPASSSAFRRRTAAPFGGKFEWLPSRALMVLFTPCLVSITVAMFL